MTKGELFKYGIKPDDKFCFCGRKDSTDHTFIHCSFTKSFIQKVTLWFNKTNNSQISPTTEELLFGITNRPFHSCLFNDLLPLNGSKAWGDLHLIFTDRPYCFCCVNQVILMLTRCIYMTKAERSLSKQGDLQPPCYS